MCPPLVPTAQALFSQPKKGGYKLVSVLAAIRTYQVDLSFKFHVTEILATFLALLAYFIVMAHHGKNAQSPGSVGAHPASGSRQSGVRGLIRSFLAASSPKERLLFLIGASFLWLVEGWPLADLANASIFAYLMQNLLLSLVAVPLMLMGTPRWVFSRLTKPRYLDWILSKLTRSLVATSIFTLTMTSVMLPDVVNSETGSILVSSLVHLWVGLAAAIMWIPALRLLPGIRQLSTAGRIAYLFTQSLLPNIPAIALIFAKHSLYPTIAPYVRSLGISAVADQQLAGGVGKIFSLLILWGAAVVILIRANRDEELGLDPELITWDDVEREFERTSKRVTPEA